MFNYSGTLHSDVFLYPGRFLGRCYGWGKVIKGERGFRCQYFYPKSIFGYITLEGSIFPIDEPGNSLAIDDLWKVARLYKIQLEMELPEWI